MGGAPSWRLLRQLSNFSQMPVTRASVASGRADGWDTAAAKTGHSVARVVCSPGSGNHMGPTLDQQAPVGTL